MSLLGKSIPHDSAEGHVTGLSMFIGDIPKYSNELIVDFVVSEHAHAEILDIDFSKALEIKGIVGIYTYKDIPGHTKIGPIIQDDYFLAQNTAEYIGHPVAVIAVENQESLKKAKQLIKIQYKNLNPILSIEEAIKNNSFIPTRHFVAGGNPQQAFKTSENMLEGQVYCAGQEHFYFESHSSLVVPEDNGNFKVFSSSQNPTEVQNVVAEVLGISFNKVVVETKRLGGAFGGKETQPSHFAAMAALVASKTNRPARIILDREKDVLTTGKRHPFLAKYKVGFTNQGVITSLELDLFANGGYSCDLSPSVMERAVLNGDNAYYIPNINIKGVICRTNFAPNTAFRGFGAPQGVFAIESIIEDIAIFLKKDSLEVRKKNLYGINSNNITPYGQLVENNSLPEIMKSIEESSDYNNRKLFVDNFNRKQNQKLRGISLVPLKYGVAFTSRFLNQANALVNIYTDGSVQVSTGGVEMGQGLNTKIRQLTADEFFISPEKVRVMATSTEKTNNTSPTAASSAFDLNGAAVLDACKKIKTELLNFASTFICPENPDINSINWDEKGIYDSRTPEKVLPFDELVKNAYFNRIKLGEKGWFVTPKVDFNKETGQGDAFLYYTMGCAVSEVEIDRYTGEIKVLRSDILMDIGKSLNPDIDRGQIAGAFLQGLGWVTMEELKYSKSGELLTVSPSNYKIPSINDIPEVFNIDWIKDLNNEINVAGSKGIGEPPFVFAISIWTAVKNALASISKDEKVNLSLPATAETVLNLISGYAKTQISCDWA